MPTDKNTLSRLSPRIALRPKLMHCQIGMSWQTEVQKVARLQGTLKNIQIDEINSKTKIL